MARALRNRELTGLVSRRAAERLGMFRRDVERALNGRVKDVVLFGSRARGDARRDSDYDVAVFVTDLTDRRVVDHMLSDIAYPHLLAGMHIVPVSVPDDFLDRGAGVGLAASIQRDGVLVV